MVPVLDQKFSLRHINVQKLSILLLPSFIEVRISRIGKPGIVSWPGASHGAAFARLPRCGVEVEAATGRLSQRCG